MSLQRSRGTTAKLKRLAAVDFAPMSLLPAPSADQFRLGAGQFSVQVRQAVRLLGLTPGEMTALPDDLADIFSNLSAAVASLEGCAKPWRARADVLR